MHCEHHRAVMFSQAFDSPSIELQSEAGKVFKQRS